MITAVLAVSVAVQLAAAIMAGRLVWRTGQGSAWGLISLALALMAARRGLTLYGQLTGGGTATPDMTAELVALLISVLMLIGVVLIGPLLERFERMRADLLQRRKNFEALAQSSSDYFWAMGSDLKFSYFSDAFTKVTGVAQEALLGRTRAEVGAPGADEDAFAAHLADLEAHRPFRDFIHSREMADGSTTYLSISGTPVFNDRGDFMGYRGTGRDITQLVDAEADVKRQSAFLSSIVENIPNMVFVKEAKELRFTLFNRAGEDLLGMPREELIGKNDYDFFPADQADFFTAKDREVLSQTEPVDIPEEPLDTVSKGKRILHTKKISLRDENGEPQFLLGISEDITDRFEMDRIKNEFVSTVSHELRTPLTSIKGSLGLIQGEAAGAISEDAQNLIGIALNNCDRLILLVDDILDMERIESGRMEYTFEAIDLNDLVEKAIASNQAYGSNLEVTFALSETVPDGRVEGDGERLEQVMANLLSNAAKYSAPGDTVEVSIAEMGDRLRIAVRDQGPGVPTAFQDRVFEKFTQADGSDSRQHGGSGLGLSIAKAIVERHGGEIGFESKLGAGSTFYFDLPALASP